MIREEYSRFLQTFNNDDIPDDVRKISNLILENSDELIPLSTANSLRVKKIVELAQEHWETVSKNIEPIQAQVSEDTSIITRLKSLTVGPFRGFARQEEFDLNDRLVLIYGQNGTGKSSFCEALEYGLLNNVLEVDHTRIELDEYLKNAHTNTFSKPILKGISPNGEEIQISPDDALYRFCFVEKNRIDSFSRITARTPSEKIRLIATLFGLDSFNKFVRGFTSEMANETHLDLTGVKAKELAEKRGTLTTAEQAKLTYDITLRELQTEKEQLTTKYKKTTTFDLMVKELRGDKKNQGLIKQLETKQREQLPQKSNLSITALNALQTSIHNNLTKHTAKQEQKLSLCKEVSFKILYKAVQAVQENSPENCPACKTPITGTLVNPYNNAKSELKKLQHLDTLEQEIEQLNKTLTDDLTKVSVIVSKCAKANLEGNLLANYCVTGTSVTTDWWGSLHQNSYNGSTAYQELKTQVQKLEKKDLEIETALQERTTKQEKLEELQNTEKKVSDIETREKVAKTAYEKSIKDLEDFDEINSQLIEDTKTERQVVKTNILIANAYKSFVIKLNEYNNALPAKLVADLGGLVCELYNQFNCNDPENEQLSSVKLPLTANDKLEIKFKGQLDEFYDALHILSEGHIRCLGLSILLAKNLKENCPILIFDDPVNAIDDEHREAIRMTLFKSNYFNNKQIILTCHGEEFFKNTQNLLSREQVIENTKTFSFLPRINEKQHINVDFMCSPRNYIVSARKHFNKGEIRNALSTSRQALESLTTTKIWRYVNKYGDGYISLKFRKFKGPIELRQLTEQLSAQIGKGDFTDQNKSNVLTPLNQLLGASGKSPEWQYLNKGTHEESDRTEFERQRVKEIIENLEAIDDAIEQSSSQTRQLVSST